jgi:hypothetical protein
VGVAKPTTGALAHELPIPSGRRNCAGIDRALDRENFVPYMHHHLRDHVIDKYQFGHSRTTPFPSVTFSL